MATRIENDCVGCEGAFDCHGLGCELTHVKHYYCDGCGDEISGEEHYVVDNEDLCEYCLKERFRKGSE